MTLKKYTQLASDFNPAPVIDVEISFRASKKSALVPMKIDTGASRTVIPVHVLQDSLQYIHPFSETRCISFNGVESINPVYVVDMSFDGNLFLNKQVIGSNNSLYYGLLGRDILTLYTLRCYGKDQKFELEYQT